MSTIICNDVEKQGYAIHPDRIDIRGLSIMPLPINVFAYKYENTNKFNIEFSDDQYDWYVIVPHKVGRVIPTNASITDWEMVDSFHGDYYGEGVGYVYLYYLNPKPITIHSKCIVIVDDGDVLYPKTHLNKCNLLIERGRAVPVYTA